MKTRKLRLLSFVLAVAMMFAVMPVSAFAADAASNDPVGYTTIDNLEYDSDGLFVIETQTDPDNSDNVIVTKPAGATYNGVYQYTDANHKQWWGISKERSYIGVRKMMRFVGSDKQVVRATVNSEGMIDGGIYGAAVTADKGIIKSGLFLKSVSTKNGGSIVGGIFANDPGASVANKHTLTAAHCELYSETSYQNAVEGGYITLTAQKPKAYVVDSQTVTLKCDSPTFRYWKVNDKAVKESDSTYTLGTDAKGNHTLTFTVSDDVNVVPVVVPVEFHIGANGLPEYNGETYMGNLDLDGWQLTPNTGSAYPYTLTVKQGTTVDFEGHTTNWAFANYGTVKNGILPGNIVNRQNTDGTYGRVENVAFKMNVNFGDQDPDITWVTLKNATACDVFPDIVGVIGKQTITIKPSISADLFKGWVVGGDISDELAEQIEKQKNNDTLVLELDGEQKDRIAVAAKTEGETFRVNMLDGKASVGKDVVTAVVPGQTVTLSIDDSEIPAGMSFDHWVVNPADVELEGGFDATSRTTSFTMPAEELTIYASLRTDSGDDGTDAMTVVAGVAVGAGVAALTYHIGTELYAEQVLGKGVAIPRTREEVALKAWELAGKPAVELNGEPLSEAAQAEKWAVESGLMQNVDGSFNGSKKMSKLKALRTLDAAKKLG